MTAGSMVPTQARETTTGLLQLVSFVVGNEEYAVPILSVQEINRMMQITQVPESPTEVEGVINLRGRIIPVIDLRKRFNTNADDQDKENRIVVVEVGSQTLGFIVDSVHEVLRVDRSIVEPPPPAVAGADVRYIEGLAKLDDRLIILLDLTQLFSTDNLDRMARLS